MSDDLALFRLEPLGSGLYKVHFGIGGLPEGGGIPKRINGVQALIQHVVMQLLTTPGTDKEDPTMGGGVRELMKRPRALSEVDQVRSDLTIAVTQIEDFVKDSQEGEALPSDERLEKLELEATTFDPVKVEWNLVIRVTTESGVARSIDVSDLLLPTVA